MKYFYLTIFFVTSLFSQTYYYEFGKKVVLNSSIQKRVISDNISYYTNENGIELGVIKDEIIVKCVDSKKCTDVLSEYKLYNIEKLTKTMFLIKLNGGEDVFEIANKLYDDSRIEFSKPNTIRKTQKR